MKPFNNIKGFTLLETLVAITVFVFIVAAAGGTFSSIQQAWRKQKAAVNLVQNARWAMEFMDNEIRQGGTVTFPGPLPAGRAIRFQPYPGTTPLVWYWRGNGGGTGNTDILYRGTGVAFAAANANRQELANFVVNNPDVVNNGTGLLPSDGLPDRIFRLSNNVVCLELTLRPIPAQPVGRENRDYNIKTQVRPRN
ncbi:MAG: prepilin-type N-terminal cleavage/methylation domain-containing protein [Candidatus Omnitrophota bacterium]